jgi:hypothetical protein
MRFYFKNGVIYGASDIAAVPYVADHVVQNLINKETHPSCGCNDGCVDLFMASGAFTSAPQLKQ